MRFHLQRTTGDTRICRIADVAHSHTYALICIRLMTAMVVNTAW